MTNLNELQQGSNKIADRLTGSVYTPLEVASPFTKLAISLFPKRNLTVLEPSVGDGLFLSVLQRDQADRSLNHVVDAVDINHSVVLDLKDHFAPVFAKASRFLTMDFLEFVEENRSKKYDLIIGNPPFIRKHNFSGSFKNSVARLSHVAEYPLSDLKNSWAAFVVAAESLLNDKGVLAFIVPYELINVQYGKAILEKIFPRFDRVDIYVPDEKSFKDIDQDAVAFIARKHAPDNKGTYINRVESLSKFESIATRPIDAFSVQSSSIDLNSFLLDSDTLELLHKLRSKLSSVGDYCTSAPGIVTAANDFFIVTSDFVAAHNLEKWALPVLKKGSFLPKGCIFSPEDFDEIAKEKPCQFLWLPGDAADEFSEELLEYLERGTDQGIPERYKCRHRQHWYEVPLVKVAPGFLFKRSSSYPRLCINDAEVLTTDTAYGIHPKTGAAIEGLCFSFYNSITMLFSELDGRFYGGGVLELTPKEFRGLPIIYKNPTDKQFNRFLAIHDKPASTYLDLTKEADSYVRKKLSLEPSDWTRIREAWRITRAHRLRHGRNQ